MFNEIRKIVGTPAMTYGGQTNWKTSQDDWEICTVHVCGTIMGSKMQGVTCYLKSKYLHIQVQVWDDARTYTKLWKLIDGKDAIGYISYCLSNLSPLDVLNALGYAYKNGHSAGRESMAKEFRALIGLQVHRDYYDE